MNDPDPNSSPAESGLSPHTDFPDWKIHGYQVLRKLSDRPDGNCTTYLAREISSHCSVVIKQWQLPATMPVLDYASYRPEIEQLQQLDYPRIPPYLNSFETPTGFCVVRAYQEGVSLAELGTLPPIDIQLIANAVLEILIYLQQLTPIVIHQNIKPTNIIVEIEGDLKVYLVDFGLDGGGSAPALSGTPGFIPPERLFGRKLTTASDLYSLGATLICLLTDTPTALAPELLDDRLLPHFHHLVPKRTPTQLIATLDKLVAPNEQDRFIDAQSARQPTFAIVSPKSAPTLTAATETAKKPKWWRWGIFFGILLGSGLLLRQFVFTDADELSPEQVAINRRIATQATFEASDRGKLLSQKRCISCNLSNQNFAKADLNGAVLSQSNLTGTNLTNTNLQLAIFQDADLTKADLSSANLSRAALYGAKLLGTRLVGANLTDANIIYANLRGAILQKANLTAADLKFTELRQADLSAANLTNADLSNANLAGANLLGAKLTDAKLDGTNLVGAMMPDGTVHP